MDANNVQRHEQPRRQDRAKGRAEGDNASRYNNVKKAVEANQSNRQQKHLPGKSQRDSEEENGCHVSNQRDADQDAERAP